MTIASCIVAMILGGLIIVFNEPLVSCYMCSTVGLV